MFVGTRHERQLIVERRLGRHTKRDQELPSQRPVPPPEQRAALDLGGDCGKHSLLPTEKRNAKAFAASPGDHSQRGGTLLGSEEISAQEAPSEHAL